jgi:hypothetical protein
MDRGRGKAAVNDTLAESMPLLQGLHQQYRHNRRSDYFRRSVVTGITVIPITFGVRR